ncbi:chromosome segregation ATPase [Campylobacter pinnipediorum subsp. pinnipediorum]|nr:chromosome segregation ATPase [Campylobacter pinnipediorum subsp. pinnipediorum]
MREYKRFFLVFFILFVTSYFFINFSQIKKEQTSQREYKIYSLKFDDLSEEEKEKYISKDQLFEYGGYITAKSYIENFDVVFDENLTNDITKLKADFKDIVEKNRVLIKDNVDIAKKNLDLISKIDSIKMQFLSKEKKIEEKNLENFKNKEKTLTDRIENLTNELAENQKQGLEMMSKYERKIIQLEQNISSLAVNYDKNTSILQNKNLELQNKISLLNKKDNARESSKKELKDLKEEIKIEKNEIQKLDFLHKKELKRIQDGFDIQRLTLEDELSKKSNNIIDLKAEIKKLEYDIKNRDTKIKNLDTQIQQLNSFIVGLNDLNKDLNSTNNQKDKDIFSLKNQILALNKESQEFKNNIKLQQNKNNSLKMDLNTSNNTIAQKDVEIKELSANIQKLSFDLNKTQNQVEVFKQLSLKNENNATILKLILDKTQEELDTQKQSSKIDMRNYAILKTQIEELRTLADRNLMIKKLQDEMNDLKNELKSMQTKNISTQTFLDKLEGLQQEIQNSIDKQDILEDENINLKKILETQTKPEVPKKLVFVSQVECFDMDKNGITMMCKNRVSEFLSRYNSNYLYEITSIVDGRGYALPYQVTSNISKIELNRLNSYVDFGIGKERSEMAAKLIRDEFGDFSRISYSTEVLRRKDSRGFIIKAYR